MIHLTEGHGRCLLEAGSPDGTVHAARGDARCAQPRAHGPVLTKTCLLELLLRLLEQDNDSPHRTAVLKPVRSIECCAARWFKLFPHGLINYLNISPLSWSLPPMQCPARVLALLWGLGSWQCGIYWKPGRSRCRGRASGAGYGSVSAREKTPQRERSWPGGRFVERGFAGSLGKRLATC